MATQKDIILKPGIGVELVFNLDSLSPISKPSIVFECDENLKEVVVAQPTQKIPEGYKYKQMHISTLISKELSDKVRMGFSCKIVKLLNNYKLANKGVADALLLKYQEPLIDINIRAAYRFHPNASFEVMGKLLCRGKEFYSGVHFKIYNISISGIGFLIPKKIKKVRNDFMDITSGKTGKILLLLRKGDDNEDIVKIESDIKVIRINSNYNPLSGFAGISFINLSQKDEEALNRFIHEAQLHEIRQSRRL